MGCEAGRHHAPTGFAAPWSLLLAFTAGLAAACGSGGDGASACPVGQLGCPCTDGGGCDPGLVCTAGTCVDDGSGETLTAGATDGTDSSGNATSSGSSAGPSTGSSGATTSFTSGSTSGITSASASGSTGATTSGSTTGASGTSGSSSTGGGGPIFDVGTLPDLGTPAGCTEVDMLFAVDGSASMSEERAALAATGAFTQIITTLEAINGGGIDYRIGVTDDDDHGWMVPGGWLGANPWFESSNLTTMEMAAAFNGAVSQVGGIGGATTGCEHVLTSATDLLAGDATGFVRPDALLVVVLITDVDDYGAYDQIGGNTCGVGCSTPPTALATLLDTLQSTVKGGQSGAVAAIVVAGDPNAAGGFNFCGQPGSCGCVEVFPGVFDCDVFHATRLWDFAGLLGTNGVTGDLCAGPASVPTTVETALANGIDLACQVFEPEG